MNLKAFLGHLMTTLIAWFLVVFVPGVILTGILMVSVIASGHYDPMTSPNAYQCILIAFAAVMALGFVGVFRLAEAKRKSISCLEGKDE